jgi:hypothetical protein
MSRHADAAARYRQSMATALTTAATHTAAIAGVGDLAAGRDDLIHAASMILGVVVAEDVRQGRNPAASALVVALQGLGQHERSLKPPARRALTDLRRLLGEQED